MDTIAKRGKYSDVWKYFTLFQGNKARCRICNIVLGYYRSSFNLRRHYLAKHSSQKSMPQDTENENATEDLETAKQEEIDSEDRKPVLPRKTTVRYHPSLLWNHFVQLSPTLKRCVHCKTVMASKSTSNMLRHMRIIHPGVDMGMPVKDGKRSVVWKHYAMEAPGKVKCVHCGQLLSYTGSELCNLRRHLKGKHPSLNIDAAPKGINSDSDELQNGGINVRSLDDLMESVEGSVSDDAYSSADRMSPKADNIEISNDAYIELQEANGYAPMPDPLNVPTPETRGLIVKASNRTSANFEQAQQGSAFDQFERNRMFFTANDLQDANFQATVQATNVVLQLQGLDSRQRIIAEKLMSEAHPTQSSELKVDRHNKLLTQRKDTEQRARCYHCQKTITCFRHGTSNCKRHLARKHPNFYNGKEYIKFNPMEEETLYDNDADDDGNYEPSINDETSQHEEEYAITEVQFVDCPTTQSKRKEMQDRADEKTSSGKLSNSISRETKRNRDSGQKEELDDTCEGKSEQVNDSFLEDIVNESDISAEGISFATSVAIQFDILPETQRTIAEKLISEVIFNGKLENLSEEAMVLVRVGAIEGDVGEMN